MITHNTNPYELALININILAVMIISFIVCNGLLKLVIYAFQNTNPHSNNISLPSKLFKTPIFYLFNSNLSTSQPSSSPIIQSLRPTPQNSPISLTLKHKNSLNSPTNRHSSLTLPINFPAFTCLQAKVQSTYLSQSL